MREGKVATFSSLYIYFYFFFSSFLVRRYTKFTFYLDDIHAYYIVHAVFTRYTVLVEYGYTMNAFPEHR